jgi:cell division protein FtsB
MPETPKRAAKAETKAKAKAKTKAVPRSRGRRSTLVLLLLGLALVAVLFAFVYPTRTYINQRNQLSSAERRLQVLEESTSVLEHDNARLQSDAEIERRAREDYGLVRPGETPYVLVPAPPTTWVP